MHNDLYDGMAAEIVEGTNILLGRGWSATRVLDDALVAGMKIVGIDFRDGILFVPEVLLAANAMKAGMAILRPLLAETGAEPVGKVVIGTVKGDIHDIGKNLVGMMLEGAGFEVFDLGINTDAEKFIAALELHKPDILGHVRAADDDHAVHEGRHPDAQGPRHPRRTTSCWSVGRRSTRSSGPRSAPTPIAATPVSPRRPPAGSSTSAAPVRPDARPERSSRRGSSSSAAARWRASCVALTRGIPGVRVEGVDCPPAHAQPARGSPTPWRPRSRRSARATVATIRIFVAYADCGTAGSLDAYLEREGVERIAGAHCYEFYAGAAAFAALQEEELGTFYLTDFLARQFDSIIWTGLGLDRHPELLPDYFGNYRRLVYLAQIRRPGSHGAGRARPRRRLGLSFERRATGFGDLATSIQHAVAGAA